MTPLSHPFGAVIAAMALVTVTGIIVMLAAAFRLRHLRRARQAAPAFPFPAWENPRRVN